MNRMVEIAVGVVLAWLVATASNAAPPPQTLPFERGRSGDTWFLSGGELHVGDGTVIKDAVVRIVGARIDRVGGKELLPSDAGRTKVVDVSGKLVTPGLIGADTTLGLIEIGAEGSTRDDARSDDHPIRAGYDASSAIFADSSLIQVNAIEGITTAAVSPNGGLISGQVAWIDLVHGAHRSIVARPRVAVDAQLGGSREGSRAGALTRLRRTLSDARFFRTRRGAHDRRQMRDLAAHPLDLLALAPVLDRRIPLTIRTDRISDMLALIALAREFRIRVVVLGGAQAWKIAGELAAADITVIVQPSRNLPGSFDTIGARLDNAALLHAAGVRVGIAELAEAHNVRNITQEAGIAVAYGLDHEAALSAITLHIAQAYGMDRHYGTAAAGKVANLVVWDGDPFELSSWPTQVYIRGRPTPMVSRQTLLRDRYLDLSGLR